MPTKFNSLFTSTSQDPLGLEALPLETNLSKLLRFSLGNDDSGLLPVEHIKEIIKVKLAEILPIPEMPSCVLGICNWRGQMLWLIDLNHLVGYFPLSTDLIPFTIILQVNEQVLGLVVQQVDDIEFHNLQQLQKAAIGLFPPKLLPFVLGAFPEGGTLLNVVAITECNWWQLHRNGGKETT
jgi:positive phototaxis protein PixI